jgi:hypothetical protein
MSDKASIPNAPGNSDWNTYQAWVAAGGVPDAESTTAEVFDKLLATHESAVQAYLDSEAVAARFDNMDRACYYALRPTSRWYAEAVTFADWRDAVWAYCEDFYAAVMAETQQIPESAEAFIGSLPVRVIE